MPGKGCGEVREAGPDIADRAARAPVPLGGEVEDPAGRLEPGGEDEDAAGPDAALCAGVAVGEEGGGVAPLELQGEAAAHDADAVDGIDDGLGLLGEDVAGGETDRHGGAPWLQRWPGS